MTSKDRPRKIIEQLYVMAQDVAPVSRARIVACLVYKNKIISYGTNELKSHPMAARFSKHPEAIHAEVAAIRNALSRYDSKIISKSTLYIARAKQTTDGDFVHGMAKPCSGCDGAILFFGIKKVFYTTGDESHLGIGYY